ncbi:MAG: DUF2059 domain-containing protein [Kiritimatiellales bacterium]
MKKMILLSLIALIATSSLALEDTPSNREKEAERYLKTTPPAEMMKDMAEKMAVNLPPKQRSDFKEMMTTYFDVVAMEKAMLDAMTKYFTADELKALADFYGSPVGKSAMSKMGAYMADVMPAVQAEVMKAQALSVKAQAEKNRQKADIEE